MRNLRELAVTDLVLMLARRKVKTKIKFHETYESSRNLRFLRNSPVERHVSPVYRVTCSRYLTTPLHAVASNDE